MEVMAATVPTDMARGPLMPSLLLMLRPSQRLRLPQLPTMAVMALAAMAATAAMVATTARGPLMPTTADMALAAMAATAMAAMVDTARGLLMLMPMPTTVLAAMA